MPPCPKPLPPSPPPPCPEPAAEPCFARAPAHRRPLPRTAITCSPLLRDLAPSHGSYLRGPSLQAQGPVQYPLERRCRHIQGCRGSLSRPGCRDTTYIVPCCYIRGGSGFRAPIPMISDPGGTSDPFSSASETTPEGLPSKRARTSGLGESSRSRPEPTTPPTDESSSPQLSPASRIRRPMFSCDPIPGNVNLRARDFHGEPYYDIPVLTADQRFRDSMWLIRQYLLLPFMTRRQFFYPRVMLEFYHTMTSQGVPSPLEIRFSIDGRPGVL